MKKPYILTLDTNEVADIQALFKEQVRSETVFIDIASKQLETTPSMQPVIDYSKKQRDFYTRAYEMLRRLDDERTQKL